LLLIAHGNVLGLHCFKQRATGECPLAVSACVCWQADRID